MNRKDDPTWTIGRILQWTTGFFEHHGIPSSRLDAEILIAHALDCQRVELYTRHSMPLGAEARAAIRELVGRRGRDREPVAYITGKKEFYGLGFEVNPAVLIPRPETECLVEAVLAYLADHKETNARVVDVGTGSGAIAVALAHHCPDLRLVATDISDAALEVARQNAQDHGVAERIEFRLADGLSVFREPSPEHERFQVVVSNPPYIDPAMKSALSPEILGHEPHGALFAEQRGDALLMALMADAQDVLVDGGAVFLEVGTEEQCLRCAEVLDGATSYKSVAKVLDLAGVARGIQAMVGKTDTQ